MRRLSKKFFEFIFYKCTNQNWNIYKSTKITFLNKPLNVFQNIIG